MEDLTDRDDGRRRVVLLQVGGFGCLALAVLGSIACMALTVRAIVDAVADFHTVNVPAQSILTLDRGHYVVYYEDTLAVPEVGAPPGLNVSIRSDAGAQGGLPIAGYGGSFTYTLGSYAGRAVGTVDIPHAGQYVVATSPPDAAGGASRVVIGPSVPGLLSTDLVPGVVGAVLVFFAVGGVGALLLTLSDRRTRVGLSRAETPGV